MTRRSRGKQHQDSASPSVAARFDINEKNIAVIRPGGTRHGKRGHWRELEFAQLAIQSLHGARPDPNLNRSKLVRDVNDWLRKNTDYQSTGLGEISRSTILRALQNVFP
jgi:hypothetical protein